MAIDRIGTNAAGALLLQGPTTAADRRTRGERADERRTVAGDAMTVQFSAAAKRSAAERAVTASNAESAASSSWFASADGARALTRFGR